MNRTTYIQKILIGLLFLIVPVIGTTFYFQKYLNLRGIVVSGDNFGLIVGNEGSTISLRIPGDTDFVPQREAIDIFVQDEIKKLERQGEFTKVSAMVRYKAIFKNNIGMKIEASEPTNFEARFTMQCKSEFYNDKFDIPPSESRILGSDLKIDELAQAVGRYKCYLDHTDKPLPSPIIVASGSAINAHLTGYMSLNFPKTRDSYYWFFFLIAVPLTFALLKLGKEIAKLLRLGTGYFTSD